MTRRATSSSGLVLLVEPEPNTGRELWRWSVSGPELRATGLALSEAEAWRVARASAAELARVMGEETAA